MRIQSLAVASMCSVCLIAAPGCREEAPTEAPGTSNGLTTDERRATPTPTTPAPLPGTQPGTQPGQQESAMDRQLSEQIRVMMVEERTFPVMVHDFVVNARGGVVTLRGRVESQDDKQRVEDRVRELPGVTRVENQLEVQPVPGGQPGQQQPSSQPGQQPLR